MKCLIEISALFCLLVSSVHAADAITVNGSSTSIGKATTISEPLTVSELIMRILIMLLVMCITLQHFNGADAITVDGTTRTLIINDRSDS